MFRMIDEKLAIKMAYFMLEYLRQKSAAAALEFPAELIICLYRDAVVARDLSVEAANRKAPFIHHDAPAGFPHNYRINEDANMRRSFFRACSSLWARAVITDKEDTLTYPNLWSGKRNADRIGADFTMKNLRHAINDGGKFRSIEFTGGDRLSDFAQHRVAVLHDGVHGIHYAIKTPLKEAAAGLRACA